MTGNTLLHEKYALAWLEMSTIIIFTIMGSLFYTLSGLLQSISITRSKFETICESINSTSEQIYSAPSILLDATRTSMLTAKTNIQRNLLSAVTILEKCAIWLIQMYKSTYRCLLGLAVHSILSIITQIAGPLQKAAQGITSFLTGGQFEVGNWTQSLTDTQGKIDTWFKNDDQLIEKIIHQPFQLIQKQINDTLNTWEPPLYNTSLLQRQQPNQTCNPVKLLLALDHVEYELKKCIYIAVGILFAVLLLCILANVYWIRFRHQRVNQVRIMISTKLKAPVDTKEHMEDSVILLDKYSWSTSTSTLFLPWPERNFSVVRFLHFMSHPIAVYCFFVGLTGLVLTLSLSCIIEAKSRHLYQDFSAQAQQWTLNATSLWTQSATQQYDHMNDWIQETELDLNKHAFGVIKSTAITINDTLTNVVNQVQDLIHTTLGGTLLESPAQDLTKCLFVNKIESIEQGLTWIANNAFINISRIDVPEIDALYLGPKMHAFISQHLQIENGSINLPLNSLLGFYYMLLLLWTFCLLIALAFQYRYYTKSRK